MKGREKLKLMTDEEIIRVTEAFHMCPSEVDLNSFNEIDEENCAGGKLFSSENCKKCWIYALNSEVK